MGVTGGAPFSVHVRSARVAFGGAPIFDRLDFSLTGGWWTCILGPSGVGKTTLMRLILGLEEPSGEISPVTCSDGAPLAGRAAYMAQQDLLLPWLSVLENVRLGSRLRGAARGREDSEERARALLESVGLATNANDRPATLSGGMRQRVALARTLMEDRPVVLMDEPFSALDAITRVKLQDLAARLLSQRTVLLVTHDPLEALRLGHRVHVMSGIPARFDDALEPEGAIPRSLNDTALLALQGELLSRLTEAAA
ncbi:MAG: ABC transporter ATP-binding protein [Rhodospirillales bacterium]|jgi:putative hydroxymethylpyrimidine transport system ATP-binding protein|nr:ABC transporter ATP-binding protein [Rhodospirillales bacterium]